MTIDSRALLQEFGGHLQRSGLFGQVVTHEPKGKPETGLAGPAAAVWIRSLQPTTAIAALNATSVVVTFMVRIHAGMLQEPQDDIDPLLFNAAERTMSLVSGDFTLGDHVDEVDLLGMAGQAMGCEFGYISVDGFMYRIADITVPVIIHDAWSQAR